MRRALAARDGGCRFPGCANHRFTDGHHVQHWVDGGPTDLENLLLLCPATTLVHDGGFSIVRDGPIAPASPLPRVVPPAPGWDGLPVDYEAAVDCLI
jgi:hypothetical protein